MSVIEQIYIDEKEDYLLDFISVGDKHIPEVSFVLIDTLGLTMAADAMRTGLPMLPQDGDYDNNGWYNFYALANAKGETVGDICRQIHLRNQIRSERQLPWQMQPSHR